MFLGGREMCTWRPAAEKVHVAILTIINCLAATCKMSGKDAGRGDKLRKGRSKVAIGGLGKTIFFMTKPLARQWTLSKKV
jgi:hypothetical protein